MRSWTGLTALLILFAATASEAQRPAPMVMPPPPAPFRPAPSSLFVPPPPVPMERPIVVQPAPAPITIQSLVVPPLPKATQPCLKPAVQGPERGGSEFAATAYGNLDCPGTYSKFELVGRVDEDSSVSGQAGMFEDKELE